MKYLDENDTRVMYEGHVRCILEGKGKMWYKDGRVYEGEFKNGCKNGQGVVTAKNGKKFDGVFLQDKFIHGTITGKDGDGNDFEYKGDVQNNLPHGSGVAKRMGKDGKWVTWRGKFENNVFLSGTMDDGLEKVIGNFKNHCIQGNGYIENKDGRKWAGIWNNGFLLDGSYNGPECEDEKSDQKWGFLDFEVKSKLMKFKSDNRQFHKIKIMSGNLKGKSCLMRIEWISAFSCTAKSGNDNVDGYWKMNTIFYKEDEFEKVLEKLRGCKMQESVKGEKIDNARCQDCQKRKRDEDNMDDVWILVSKLAKQEKNDS